MAEEIKLMKGNEAIAHAAVRYGVDGYFGYPITPHQFYFFCHRFLCLGEFNLIDCNYPIRADHTTASTADAVIQIFEARVMVALVVHLRRV